MTLSHCHSCLVTWQDSWVYNKTAVLNGGAIEESSALTILHTSLDHTILSLARTIPPPWPEAAFLRRVMPLLTWSIQPWSATRSFTAQPSPQPQWPPFTSPHSPRFYHGPQRPRWSVLPIFPAWISAHSFWVSSEGSTPNSFSSTLRHVSYWARASARCPQRANRRIMRR